MPMTWVEPEALMTWRGVTVYHTYRDGTTDMPSEYWYTLDVCEDREYQFDVRDFPVPAGAEASRHDLIIQAALDAGCAGITFPDDVELELPLFDVPAEAHTDCQRVTVEFDAAKYLKEAEAGEILKLAECGWRGDYPADAVAEWMAAHDYRIAQFFALKDAHARHDRSSDPVGFECSVDEAAAMVYLQQHRPDLYWAIKVLTGEAVELEGTVVDPLSASKTVTTFVDLSQTAGGEVDTASADFAEAAEAAVREAAFGNTLQDFDHGWEILAAGDQDVRWSIKDVEKKEAAHA